MPITVPRRPKRSISVAIATAPIPPPMLNIISTTLACTRVSPRDSTIDGSQFIRKYSTTSVPR